MTGTIRDKKVVGPDGEWVVQKVYLIDGREVTEAEYREHFPAATAVNGIMTPPTGCWPMTSEALACHPDQIPEARASAEARGVQTDFTPDGSPIFRDRDHRRRYMRAYGYHDKDGGYGDAQPAPPRKRISLPPDHPDVLRDRQRMPVRRR